MIRPLAALRTIGVALLAVIVTAAPAQAQNYFRNAPNRLSGHWTHNTLPNNWATSAAGPVNTTWNINDGSISVNFGDTAGTVTLIGPPEFNVAGINFTTSNYTLTGGAIGMVGIANIATINTGANNATINSALAGGGSVTVVKSGAGTLTLGGNNNFGGPMAITQGAVAITHTNPLGHRGP